ncbi:SsrA-binding protein [Litorimonas taeanensis]|uniref:SsrA-binding protein n=1 Tax=Litorimonas taeanensis TaxID=568099 RepID=A0A420WKC7_9PROT|nr:SsrA-binding protein SmpB [Litorimonas taeanensis]RKQ71458.1 SsrA-binding protein [Litorimonas taeanensis]
MAKAKENKPKTQIADNRRARFNYAIEDNLEAGIQLVGTEVKSLREGKANIAEAYVSVEGNEAWLINANIPIYAPASQFNHSPTRPRKLLLKRREINALLGETQRKGRTVVPLKLYFNKEGRAKILIGVGAGKQNYDKRQTQKNRDWQKQKARLMREKG